MSLKLHLLAACAASSIIAVLSGTAAQAADSIAYNSQPADGWYFGSGNDYSPSNTAVLSTDQNDQIYLRVHKTYETAPASNANGVYNFALGTDPVSVDWGIDANNGLDFSNISQAYLSFMNLSTGFVSQTGIDPLTWATDNEFQGGSVQNSVRLNWFDSIIDFKPNTNVTYQIDLDVIGLNPDDVHELTVFARFGGGSGAVPEPATWAMMLLGFGGLGATLRHRRQVAA
jgi:hypothetical protein